MSNCQGEHHYFVAEVVGIETEGTVHVLAICTDCGELKNHKVQVSTPGVQLRLLREERRQAAGVQKEN